MSDTAIDVVNTRAARHPAELAMDILLDRWLPGGEVSGRAYWRLRKDVLAIGAAIGVVDPVHAMPYEHGTVEHQTQVIAAAADGFARRLVGGGATAVPRFSFVPTGGEPPIAGVVPAILVERLDVNAASPAELADLPGLGSISARRIVAHRRAAGPYVDLEEVRRAARLSPRRFEPTALHLHVGDGMTPPATSTAAQRVHDDGLAGLLGLWSEGMVALPGIETNGATAVDVLIRLVADLASELRLVPLRPPLWAPNRDRLRRAQTAQRRDDGLATAGARTSVRAAPVFSAGYLRLLLGLLDAAEQQVLVSMFYFTIGEIEDLGDPGDRIVDALVNAIERGVDVRLIIDDDLPEDRHGANAVNTNTFIRLGELGIPVRPDHLEVTAHAKAVVVDRRFVVIGSHNWTASSFFRYQETGCLVDSTELGEQVATLLERRWQLLASPEERVVPLEHSELLDPEQRAAVVTAGLADGPAFVKATRLASQREALAGVLGIGPDDLVRIRKVVRLMQAFRISETTAVALVADGLDAPSEVRRATPARLRKALGNLARLEDPFGLCRLLPEFADWLATRGT